MYFLAYVYAQLNRAQTVQPVASRCSQNKLLFLNVCLSIPLTMLSKVYICGRSIAEIGGSNPDEGMDARFWYLLCAPCVMCDIETSTMRRPTSMPDLGRCVSGKEKFMTCHLYEIFGIYISRRASVCPFDL